VLLNKEADSYSPFKMQCAHRSIGKWLYLPSHQNSNLITHVISMLKKHY